MNTPSSKCYDLIKQFEGLFLNAYPDPATGAEPYTIGYGTTIYPDGKKVKLGDSISEQEAYEYLVHEVNEKAKGVDKLVTANDIKQQQFDALVSFAYNCGLANLRSSTLLKRVNANPNDPDIRNQFMRWNKAAGKVMRGLTRRRKAEADLYFS